MSAADNRPTVGLHTVGGRFVGGQKPKNMRGTIVRLWRLFGRQKRPLIAIFLLASLGSGIGLIGPWLIGRAIDAIDGASGWQQFIKISVPLVKPTTVYVLTISIYAGLSMFLESNMLFKGNNSPNNIGLTIVGYLYRQGVEKRALGYACAVGLILLLVVMAVNLIQLKVTGTFDEGRD